MSGPVDPVEHWWLYIGIRYENMFDPENEGKCLLTNIRIKGIEHI